MTSSTKPEVHNISQRRQKKNAPRPQATCVKNLVKFGSVVFELCDRTDKQTDILITTVGTSPGAK